MSKPATALSSVCPRREVRLPPLVAKVAIAGSGLQAALATVGDRWSLAIIRAAFLGATQFDQFITHLEVPKQTLSLRLKDLVAHGVLSPRPYQSNPVRVGYRLTELGLRLYPNALASWLWERRWAGGRGSFPLPSTLTHKACGCRMTPKCVCAACRGDCGLDDVEFVLGAVPPGPRPDLKPRRWSHRAASAASGQETDLAFGLSVDRWALLIVSTAMLGLVRFDALQTALGVGSSVLANRLSMLCAAGLLERSADPDDGRRFIYRPTAPARDLFHHLATLSEWGRTAFANGVDGVAATHLECGAIYRPLMVCDACGAALSPRDVTFSYA